MELNTIEWIEFIILFFSPILLLIASILMLPRFMHRTDENDAKAIHYKITKRNKKERLK